MSLCWHYELLSRGRKNKRATPRRSDQQNAFEFRRSWIGKYSLFIFFGSVFFLPFVEPLKKRRPLKRLDQSSLKLKDRLRPGKKCVFFLRRLYVRTDLRKIRQLKNVLKNLHQLCPKLKDRLRNIFRNIRPFCWSVRWFIFFCRDFFISKRFHLKTPKRTSDGERMLGIGKKKHFQQFLFDAERLIATMSFQTISLSAQFVFSTCVCVCVWTGKRNERQTNKKDRTGTTYTKQLPYPLADTPTVKDRGTWPQRDIKRPPNRP